MSRKVVFTAMKNVTDAQVVIVSSGTVQGSEPF